MGRAVCKTGRAATALDGAPELVVASTSLQLSHVLRSLRDLDGVTWRVWAVLPVSLEPHRIFDPATGRERLPLPPELAAGWLAFESATGERRRVGPLPHGWEDLGDADLLHVLGRATAVARAYREAGVAARPETPPPMAS
jgi:hypothetical protein